MLSKMKTPLKRRIQARKYQRKYRVENKDKVMEYNRKTVKERASRNKARAELIKRVGKSALKNKDVHHVDGNTKNNSKRNLRVVKRHHGGGPRRRR